MNVIKPQTEAEFSLAVFLQGALNRRGVETAIDVDRCLDYRKGGTEKDLWRLVEETPRPRLTAWRCMILPPATFR